MKKRWMIILLILLTGCLCSCSLSDILPTVQFPQRTTETVTPYKEVKPDNLTYSEGYEPVASTYSYDALPKEGEKLLYNKILENCYDISPDPTEGRYPMPRIELNGYSLSEAEVRTTSKALTDDHPEIFWLTGTIGFYTDESMTVIQTYSNFSPEEVGTRVSAMRSAANAFYTSVPDGLSAFEREVMVHDFLIDHVEYDKNVDTINLDNNNPDTYTAYGALVNKVSVCEGYVRAFQMLLNGLGVECVGVIGESQNQMHIWNAVKLDGSWYYVDPTWDDQEQTYARHLYCNVNEDYLLEDHTISPLFTSLDADEINGITGEYSASVMNIFIPECIDDSMGYYRQKTPHLRDYDAADVKSGMLTAAQRQEDYFVFYVEDDLDFQTVITDLFVDYPQHFFTYINAVNNSLSDYSVDESNIGYFSHERSRIVAVELHYY
ncbi:transglutaminase domain-containing protein [Ruminococcus sp.]|uniref:transglutaminase domain-containing protein n=1 Tax=Ruminococcus sp. TaxID=41978 RepID=UPI003862FB24